MNYIYKNDKNDNRKYFKQMQEFIGVGLKKGLKIHHIIMRLQGMNPSKFHLAVSYGQLGKQLGNAMSINVLERIFVQLLPAAGLAQVGSLQDRWVDGTANPRRPKPARTTQDHPNQLEPLKPARTIRNHPAGRILNHER